MTDYDLLSALAKEATQGKRYGGGKMAKTKVVTAMGSTLVYAPTPGKRLAVYWVYAINDPAAASAPQIKVKLGAEEIYLGWVVSHWEEFVGAVDEPLTVELSAAANVLVTAHVKEID